MDLPKVPELSGSRLAETKKDLAALGIVISDLGASSRMHEKDPAVREKQLDEGRRFIDLAQALSVPYVRMFGDKLPPDEPKEEVMKRVVEGFQEMAAYAKTAGVTVIIESHGDFTHSSDLAADPEERRLAELRAAVGRAPHLRRRPGGARRYLEAARPQVRHTHLKDSVPEGTERRYVLTGTGQVPVKEQVRVLATGGYKGFYCFEWEKKWHPEIEEPEIAFPQYAKTMREYLAEAGVKTS